MTDLDLDAITARADAATPGPWTFRHEMVTTLDYDDVLGGNFGGEGGGYAIDSDEGEFIAHAREDVPALVAAVRELQDVNDALYGRWSALTQEKTERRMERDEAREAATWAQLAADTQKERADKLQAAIDGAPHDKLCIREGWYSPAQQEAHAHLCNCWKAGL